MKTNLIRAFKQGITAGVILIFFEMINLTSTLAIILEKIVRNVKSITSVNPFFVQIVLGIILFFVAFSFARHMKESTNETRFSTGMISATCIGATAGTMITILNLILGHFLTNGIDLRGYLEALSPDVIRTFLFQSTIGQAALIYFATTISGALLGAFIFYISDKTGQPMKTFRFLRKVIRGWQLPQKVNQIPALRVIFWIAIFLVVFASPLFLNSYSISILGIVCIYSILGLGLNLIVGLSGQLVFGYVAFYAIGAYTFALLTAPKPLGIQMQFIPAFLIALFFSGIAGGLVGLPIMNLRGDYLAIVTLGFAEIIRILINSNRLTNYTGGPQGIKNIGQPVQPNWLVNLIGGKPLDENVWFLYLIFILFLIILYTVHRLQYSRTGRSWEAMREDETVAQACGVSTSSYKVLAIVIGAIIAGAAGAIYASRNTYIGPSEYGFMVSVNALAVIVVGGMGSIPGALLGSFIIKGVPELLRDLENYRLIVFGALLIIMMVIRPEGILPVKRRKIAVAPESIDILKEEMKQ